MWRVMFFFLGVPMMIMSFFEAVDVLPYAQSFDLIVNGNEIEISQEQQDQLQQKVFELFEGCHTMPAFGVVFDDMYHDAIKDGIFVSMKFDQIFQVNELPFDELVFQVLPDFHGFNLMRGIKGVFQGRCIYIDLLEKDMSQLHEYITSLPAVQNAVDAKLPEIENGLSQTIETPKENEEKNQQTVEETPQEEVEHEKE